MAISTIIGVKDFMFMRRIILKFCIFFVIVDKYIDSNQTPRPGPFRLSDSREDLSILRQPLSILSYVFVLVCTRAHSTNLPSARQF